MDIVERFSNPTKYDLAPCGTIYRHEDKLFIQVSTDPELSNWIPLGDFFLEINRESILNDDFMKKCINIYLSKNIQPKGNFVPVSTSKEE